MKEKTKDEKNKKEAKQEPTETTGTGTISAVRESTGIDTVAEVKKIDKLNVGFPNEDMNQVVAKLNELIDKLND